MTSSDFAGGTYSPTLDRARLATQLDRAVIWMKSRDWFTVAELAGAIGASECSASARIRDARKQHNGSWLVDRKRIDGGLWKYKLVGRRPTPPVVQGVLFDRGGQ